MSITHQDGSIILSFCGIKLKMSQGLRLEQDNGGAYGMFHLIRERAGIPFCVREITCQHGWDTGNVLRIDLRDAKCLMLCWSARFSNLWCEQSQIPCEIVGAPFVHYRRANGIRVADDARGTVSFPAHSTRQLCPEFDVDAFCDQLHALPAEFQPVTVCLHPADIELHHMDEAYHRRGFSTVCAGHDQNRPFYEAFYDILRRHKFATSNALSSSLFYAVEMGIPFFFTGEAPVVDNRARLTIDATYDRSNFLSLEIGRFIYHLFGGSPSSVITAEQRAFVLQETGMTDCLTPEELGMVLRRVAVNLHYVPNRFKRTIRYGLRLLRHPLHANELLRFHHFLVESLHMINKAS